MERLERSDLVPEAPAAYPDTPPLLRRLAEDVFATVARFESEGLRPPSHVSLPADEYDAIVAEFGWPRPPFPYEFVVSGVEVRRVP